MIVGWTAKHGLGRARTHGKLCRITTTVRRLLPPQVSRSVAHFYPLIGSYSSRCGLP